MYGVMIAVGLLAAFGVLFFYGKKMGLDESFLDFVFYDAIAAVVLGFGSAALFTLIGGLIGGAAAFLILYALFRKKLKNRLLDCISMLPCCILIAHGFGRIGCFFAGCCYGKETDCFLGVKFPNLPKPVHPTQLYEAAFLFLMFGLCSYLLLKKKFRHNMSVYLVSYGLFRFLIEFIRDDHRGALVGGISPSQFWSLLMIAAGIGVYFFTEYLWKKRTACPVSSEDKAEAAENTESKDNDTNEQA